MKQYIKLFEQYTQDVGLPDGHPGFIQDKSVAREWIEENMRMGVLSNVIDFCTFGRDERGLYCDVFVYTSMKYTVYLADINFIQYIPVRFRKFTNVSIVLKNSPLKSLYGMPEYIQNGSVELEALNDIYTLYGISKFIKSKYDDINHYFLKILPISTLEYLDVDNITAYTVTSCSMMISGYPYDNTLITHIAYREDLIMNGNFIENYFETLEHSPDVKKSIEFLKTTDKKVYDIYEPYIVEYCVKNNIDIGLSDDVKNIAGAAMKGNHKLR